MRPLRTAIALAILQSAFLSPLHAAKSERPKGSVAMARPGASGKPAAAGPAKIGGKPAASKASVDSTRAPKTQLSEESEFDLFETRNGAHGTTTTSSPREAVYSRVTARMNVSKSRRSVISAR